MNIKTILIIAAAQTVLIALTAAGTWFMFLKTQPSPAATGPGMTAAAAPAIKAEPIYLSIDPALVVNLQGNGKMRFLQLQLEVMTRDQKVDDLLEKHASRIRNDLIFQLGELSIDDLRQPDGKATIQENARTAINAVLAEEAGKAEAIEAVYFTKFVIQ